MVTRPVQFLWVSHWTAILPNGCGCLSHDSTYILAHPATIPILTEKQALELLPSFVLWNHELFLHKQWIFITSQQRLSKCAHCTCRRSFTRLSTLLHQHCMVNHLSFILTCCQHSPLQFSYSIYSWSCWLSTKWSHQPTCQSYAASFMLSQQSVILDTDLPVCIKKCIAETQSYQAMDQQHSTPWCTISFLLSSMLTPQMLLTTSSCFPMSLFAMACWWGWKCWSIPL